MIGDHWIKGWSKTQHCITLSSAEAELYAMVEGVTRAKGLITLARCLWVSAEGLNHLCRQPAAACGKVNNNRVTNP